MADVAREAGVSRALVSIVFRGAPGASASTRERVLGVARELGYHPHTAAQVLRRARSRHLGVLFTPRNPFEVEIVEGMYPAAEARGYRLVLSAMTPTRRVGTALDELAGYRSEALILVGLELEDPVPTGPAQRVPVVRISRHADAHSDVVRSDDEKGMSDAVDFLVGLGHHRIVHVDGGSMPGADDRRDGYLKAMERHGLAGFTRVIPGDYTEQSGASAARTLLAEEQLPTAVITGNDWCAFGVLTTFAQARVEVPGEVSVVGYDDSRLARLPFVQLSSVRQDAGLLGEMAVRAAVERLEGRRAVPREIVLEPRFVPRGTTAVARPDPPPARMTQG
ncbi:LacI family DNA-binding transcriptional regulator [Intrasporangium sp.]|uniref:LacI family DNA-binding transcriptional regulator n=1 Tax=Intrasporangium sp. TaxID=1925024 RepID=UPI003221A36F